MVITLLSRLNNYRKAGSGLHIHMRIMKDGQNQMLKEGVYQKQHAKLLLA